VQTEILSDKLKGTERLRRGWENDIKICIKEIGCDALSWIYLA
jgi:hypothetical protein